MFQRHFFQYFLCSSKTFQIVLECMLQGIVFNIFSAVPNRFKYRPNACFIDIVLIFSLQFQNVLNTVRIHALETLFSKCSMQFQIVSNTVRMHALETLFSIFSLHLRIVLNTVRKHVLETLFSKCSMQFQIVSNTVRMYESIKAYL